jgi:hypothetical protein
MHKTYFNRLNTKKADSYFAKPFFYRNIAIKELKQSNGRNQN